MNIYISLLLSMLLATLAFLKKALTKPALILALCCSIIICYYGNLKTFLVLVFVFLGSIITKKINKNSYSDIIAKTKAKDIIQIIANVSVGTLTLIIYHYTNNKIFYLSFFCIMAESLADTLASDIGILSKKPPINILTLKKSTPGLSGNISFLGLFAAFIGSLLISIVYSTFDFNLTAFLIIIISSIFGCIIDSILGASIQVKYKCPKCELITEKKYHCNQKTIYYKGLKFINNDTVNFLSNIITMLISIILLTIF